MPRIQFPNVPKLPGVPQLLRSNAFPAAPPPIVGTALGIARLIQIFVSGTGWGIYKSETSEAPTGAQRDEGGHLIIDIFRGATQPKRQPVLVPDSFRDFDSSNEWTVSNYPIQQGGFASYDRVNNPFEVTLRLAKGGSQQERSDFLKALDEISDSLLLYDIVTPEKTYLNVSITRVRNARRGSQGAYFFAEVDVTFQEIRLVTPEYLTSTSPAANTTNAKNQSAVPVQNQGAVQVQPTPPNVDTEPQV